MRGMILIRQVMPEPVGRNENNIRLFPLLWAVGAARDNLLNRIGDLGGQAAHAYYQNEEK
jgi:hypothetical protein